jgi:hypothetical protein
MNDALAISTDYQDLLSYVTRITMGGTEITISKGLHSQWDESDVQMFMKDIGSGRWGVMFSPTVPLWRLAIAVGELTQ